MTITNEMTAVSDERLAELIEYVDWTARTDKAVDEVQAALRELQELRASRAQSEQLHDNWQVAAAEVRRLRTLIETHNTECRNMCGTSAAAKGVACGYRPYFPRRCSDCPERNWVIDIDSTPSAGGG